MKVALLLIFLLFPLGSWSQVLIDPSSALLLKGDQPVVESSRYQIRPKEKSEAKRDLKARKSKEPELVSEDNEQESRASSVQEEAPEANPILTNTPPNGEMLNQSTNLEKKNSVGQQVREAILGKSRENPSAPVVRTESENQKQKENEASSRIGLRLEIAPMYTYNDSSSTYWFRRYYSSSPGFHVGVDVVAQNDLLLYGSFDLSMGAFINTATDFSNHVAATQQLARLGIRAFDGDGDFRISYGVGVYDYQFRVPSDAMMRVKLRTVAPIVHFGFEKSRGTQYLEQFEAAIGPRAMHKEYQTGYAVQSGDSSDCYVGLLSFGGEMKGQSKNTYFWKLEHRFERTVYSGSASQPDPISGATPNGVAVTNSFTNLYFGIRLGP